MGGRADQIAQQIARSRGVDGRIKLRNMLPGPNGWTGGLDVRMKRGEETVQQVARPDGWTGGSNCITNCPVQMGGRADQIAQQTARSRRVDGRI